MMKAAAYIVGPLDGSGTALMDIARLVDFAMVRPWGGVGDAEAQANHTPICFFLFAAVGDPARLRDAAEAIRFCPSRRVRFSPMIYFSPNPSVETISACIEMGFDDVVSLPAPPARVRERLRRQLARSLVFSETGGYFGPDRRERIARQNRAGETPGGGHSRRLEIVRHPDTGVEILRDDFTTGSRR